MQSPIRIGAIALSKSPVSLTLGDEAPHIFTRKSRLRPLEFLTLGAKRLLQSKRGRGLDCAVPPGLVTWEPVKKINRGCLLLAEAPSHIPASIRERK
jgi:hypothetical protein